METSAATESQASPIAASKSKLYKSSTPPIPPAFSTLLSVYSGIPPAEQESHVSTLRDEAYKVYHYPCLGLYRFLNLHLSRHPLYQKYVLPTLKSQPNTIFLDLGCCLAQDVRKVAFDGVPVESLYGADLLPEFIELGYQLFKDEEKLPRDHMLGGADVFDEKAGNVLSFAKGKGKEGKQCILGQQIGNVNPNTCSRVNGGKSYRHNESTWISFWEERMRDETNGKYGFEAYCKTIMPDVDEAVSWRGEGYRWLVWWVWVWVEEHV